MKQLVAVLLLASLVFLVACESRTGNRSGSGSSMPESASIPPEPASSAAGSQPESSGSSSLAEPDRITDPEQVATAKEIVAQLFDRAAVADEIFRTALRYDSALPEMRGDREYYMVTDERFATVDDVKTFMNETFTRGGEAARRFEKLQSEDNPAYVSANQQLYIDSERRQSPLMMGGWKIETMELLSMDDTQIEVRMESTLLGRPDGVKTLRIVRDGELWLLGDSYFLD